MYQISYSRCIFASNYSGFFINLRIRTLSQSLPQKEESQTKVFNFFSKLWPPVWLLSFLRERLWEGFKRMSDFL